MKIIFKIHPFFYLLALICIITGYFKNFLFITFIIVFHEMGHVIVALFLKWKIDRVIMLPFGAITIFDELINRPIKEEFLIALMGPLFQCFLFVIDNNLFRTYNIYLLLFNLLPLIPLDGSKLLNLLFNKILSFKLSHFLSIILSFISIILLAFKYNLILYITLFLLFKNTFKELLNHRYIFNRFLLERYIYNFNFKKSKIVSNKTYMKRDYKHIFKLNNKYITERMFLLKMFDK